MLLLRRTISKGYNHSGFALINTRHSVLLGLLADDSSQKAVREASCPPLPQRIPGNHLTLAVVNCSPGCQPKCRPLIRKAYFLEKFAANVPVFTAVSIHMNGRIYDPHLARMLQADPFIQFPTNMQSYNRFSYVLNNPLSFTDPSGYLFDPVGKWIKKKVTNALGYEISSALVIISAAFCGPVAPECAAYGQYDLAITFGAEPIDALRVGIVAGVSQWAFGGDAGAPTIGDTATQLSLSVIAAKNPAIGQALMFVSGNWNDPSKWAQNAVGATVQYYASRKISEVAARYGLTLQEFNLVLALNSKLGLILAGSTYDSKTRLVGGFFSRDGEILDTGSLFGAFWDVNDTLLNAQGLLDAVSMEIARSGDRGALAGHSLGAARVNNLYRQGFIDYATTLSLPLFAYPAAGSQSFCASLDPVCLGGIGNLVRPGANHVDTPGYLPVHTIRSVPGYETRGF